MWRDRRLLVLAGAIVGLAAGGLVTLLQDDTFRADAAIVIVRQGQPPGSDPDLARSAEAAAELFNSRAVAESAVTNLQLETSANELLDRVEIEAQPDSSLVRLTVDAASADEARRTAQELAEVATVLFNDRFGTETIASIWEAPRAQDGSVSPKPERNLLLGALLGLLAGAGGAVARGRRHGEAALPASAAVAGPPWTISDLDRLVAAASAAPAAKRDEWRRLIAALREFAGPGGEVPRRLDQLVETELLELLAR